jgi:hypothetical protein
MGTDENRTTQEMPAGFTDFTEGNEGNEEWGQCILYMAQEVAEGAAELEELMVGG